jgi:hypothetical protein
MTVGELLLELTGQSEVKWSDLTCVAASIGFPVRTVAGCGASPEEGEPGRR